MLSRSDRKALRGTFAIVLIFALLLTLLPLAAFAGGPDELPPIPVNPPTTPTESSSESTEPSSEPTEPTPSTEPTGEPTEPAPSSEPTEPTPSSEPTEPPSEPTEPTPTGETGEPTEPTPTGETGEPTEPVESTEPEIPPETESHGKYVSGSSDGLFYPTKTVTRAELAVMLYGLLQPADGEASFPDVGTQWFAKAVNALTAIGVFSGYPDGTFKPMETVTRAVLAQTLYKVSGLSADGLSCNFDDVKPMNWAYPAISLAQTMGWMVGDGSGSFYPTRTLTRAEAVTAINKCFSRTPDAGFLTAHPEAAFFPDVKPGKWYYFQVLEAACAHTCLPGETAWYGFTPAVSPLAPGFYAREGCLYLVQDDGTYCLTAGEGTYENVFYYCAGASGEIALPGISGTFETRDGAVLLLDGTPAPAGTVEFDGALYCVKPDGNLVRSGYWELLYFDAAGKYTTTYADIDEYIETIVRAVCTDEMTREQKLRALYLYEFNHIVYQAAPTLARGANCEDWMPTYMRLLITRGKGNCYTYAAEMVYLARRLGYPALGISGGALPENEAHGWCVIKMDGRDRLFDPELNYFRLRADDTALYMKTYEEAPLKYWP